MQSPCLLFFLIIGARKSTEYTLLMKLDAMTMDIIKVKILVVVQSGMGDDDDNEKEETN